MKLMLQREQPEWNVYTHNKIQIGHLRKIPQITVGTFLLHADTQRDIL